MLVKAAGVLMSSGAALSPRRATHLSFASPKESKPRKGDPGSCVPALRFGQPAVLGKSGVPLELGFASDNRGPLSAFPCAPRRIHKGFGEWGEIPEREQNRKRNRNRMRTGRFWVPIAISLHSVMPRSSATESSCTRPTHAPRLACFGSSATQAPRYARIGAHKPCT